MLHSRTSSTFDGDKEDRDGQDAWSSAFPPSNDQPFDRHSFGRMDRATTPPLSGDIPIDTKTPISRLPLSELSTVPSFSNDPLVLNHAIAPAPSGSSRGRGHSTSPARHDELYELDNFNAPPQPQDLYRNVHPGEITPYIGLRSRLTQIPINRWTTLLMLVLARLIILFESLNTNLASAQDEAAAACLNVEEIGSAMASMPHYVSVGVNKLVAMGITDTLRGLIKILVMILSGVLEMLMFIIERTYGTIVCVADSFIKGLIALAAAAVEGLLQDIDDDLRVVAGGVSDALDDFSTALDGAIDAENWLGFKVPSLSSVETAIEGVKNANFINATATFNSITDFDEKIPNFNGIIADVQAVVGIPFTTIERLLNESFGNWSMDPSVFPTASKEQLTFCTGNDTIMELFDVLFIVAKSAKTIAICGFLLAALLAAAFMAWLEFQRYRKAVVESKVLHNREPMDSIYITGRPLTAGMGLWVSRKISNDPNCQMLIRWVVAYATTYTALFVLSLAVAGAFSVLCQFFIMRAVQKEAPGLAQQVGAFVTNATDALDSSSAKWANESNQAILDLQNDINDKIFIHLQDATGAVVNLINAFENETTTLLQNFFGKNPIGVATDNFTEGLLDCVIFDSLDKVESGITWLNEEAHVTLPEFPVDVFSMGATGSSGTSSFSTLLTKSGAQAANDITSALNKVVSTLQSSIVQEGLIALALFLVYIAYVLFAVAQAALRLCCMKGCGLPEDVEKGDYAMKELQAAQDTIRDKGKLIGTTRSPSIAPSYRLSNLDVSQLARELLVMQEEGNSLRQMPAEHVEATDMREEYDDPFRDDTYAIGDEEMDDLVGVLHNSRQKADLSTSQISQSVDDDFYAIGDEEVNDVVSGLRQSRQIVDSSGPRSRQAWAEDADE
ncbi:plasma membrane fusion protein prm1 [Gnomoniopsis sp. IMI 355080]|nr:plasma membrane fusion protein prm1 [Gnomoniopsis sp. IMI 355080]